MRRGRLSKLAVLMMAVLLFACVFAFVACGDKQGPGEQPSGEPSECSHPNAAWTVVTEPGCTQKGSEALKCPDCLAELDTRETDATGHVNTSWHAVEPATCTAGGSEQLECDKCHTVLDTRATDATGHLQFDWVTVKKPTCTEDGLENKVCRACKAVIDTRKPSATGHTEFYVVIVKRATCTEDGVKNKVCRACDTVIGTEAAPATGHDYPDWTVIKEPTLGEKGLRYRMCSHDTDHVDVQDIPKLSDDTYTVTNTAATCEAAGKTTYTSATYGSYSIYTPKPAHDYSTIATDGKCGVCDAKLASAHLVYTPNAAGNGYVVSRDDTDYADPDLVIPAQYNGLPVKEIADGAFSEVPWIKTVTIPESIEVIGAGAFSMMDGLTKVYYNAQSCGDLEGRNWAFYPGDSQKAYEVVIGAKVKRIPSRLFFPLYTSPHCPARVGKLTFEEGSVLEEIGEDAFYRSTLAGSVEFPASLKSIEYRAFYGTRITSVTLGGIEDIGDYVFYGCDSMKSAVLGASLRTIGLGAFEHCSNLKAIDLSRTHLTTIAANAFKDCGAVTLVTLPDTLTTIGDAAFEGLGLVKTLTLNDGLRTVGSRAFYGWLSLAKLTISESVQTIGNSAFENAFGLEELRFNAAALADLGLGNRVFTNAGNLVEGGVTVIIGNNVGRIAARLFYSTSDVSANIKIKKLTVSSGVTAIGDRAFYGVTVTTGEYLGAAADWAALDKGTGNGALSVVTAVGTGA